MYRQFPKLTKDAFWDEIVPDIPYTNAAAEFRGVPYYGSTQAMKLVKSYSVHQEKNSILVSPNARLNGFPNPWRLSMRRRDFPMLPRFRVFDFEEGIETGRIGKSTKMQSPKFRPTAVRTKSKRMKDRTGVAKRMRNAKSGDSEA